MGIPGRSKAHVFTKGRCFDRTGAMKEQTEEEPDKDKEVMEVMEERIVEEEVEVEVEWGFYALSASKAIFRARTYNCNLFSPVTT